MRLSHRFLILYFGLYFFPFPLTVFSGLAAFPPPLAWIGSAAGRLEELIQMGLGALAIWAGEDVLRLGKGAVIVQPTGSGDTLLAYLQTLCVLTIAALGTAAWTVFARERTIPPRIADGFRVYVRYAVGAILLSYGFAKIPPTQFQPPGPELLVRTYGESSPMGLLWTFMGFSPAYTMFAGLMEIVPGLLLLFRRTTLLGALIGAGTMANVMALNFFYDVPVKLFSTHLLVALLALAAPDARRLLDFFVLNRPVAPAALGTRSPSRRRLLGALKAAVVLTLLAENVIGGYQAWHTFGAGAPTSPLAGIYDVEAFSLNGEVRPPLWTDRARWRRLLVARRGTYAVVQWMGGTDERFSLKTDEKSGTFVLAPFGGTDSFTLGGTRPAPDRLVIEGPFRDGRIRVELRRTATTEFPVNTRGFRWIQELPYNR